MLTNLLSLHKLVVWFNHQTTVEVSIEIYFQIGKFKTMIKKRSKEEQDKLREKYREKYQQISASSPGGIKKPKTHPLTLRSEKKMKEKKDGDWSKKLVTLDWNLK